jgi:hypothetical protein
MNVDGHGVHLVGPGQGEHRTGHPLGLQVAAAADITDRGMGQVDLVGAPGRGRIRPLLRLPGGCNPLRKKVS